MKVKIKDWSGSQTLPLEAACTPYSSADDRGQLETVETQLQLVSDTLGRLIANLIEKHILTIDEAKEMISDYGDWEIAE